MLPTYVRIGMMMMMIMMMMIMMMILSFAWSIIYCFIYMVRCRKAIRSDQVRSYEKVEFKSWGIKERVRQDMYDDDDVVRVISQGYQRRREMGG